MKLLLDMGLSPRTAEYLRSQGHGADHLSSRGLHRLADRDVMTLAADEGRTIVTFDLEFSPILAIQQLVQPSVILFRLERFSTDDINLMLSNILATYSSELSAGAIIVFDPSRVRVQMLPIW